MRVWNTESRRAKSEGWGSWGGGNQPCPTSYGSGERCELPKCGLERSPRRATWFAYILSTSDGLWYRSCKFVIFEWRTGVWSQNWEVFGRVEWCRNVAGCFQALKTTAWMLCRSRCWCRRTSCSATCRCSWNTDVSFSAVRPEPERLTWRRGWRSTLSAGLYVNK